MKQITLLGMLLIYSTFSFAYSDCPFGEEVKKQILKQAVRLDHQQWSLTSSSFKANGRMWTVMFNVTLTEANNNEQALTQGRKRFVDVSVTNNHPYPQNDNGVSYCYYTPNAKDSITAYSFTDDGVLINP